MTVVIVGASNKHDRYSYQALLLLKSKGHAVIPVHPVLDEIEGVTVCHHLKDILGAVDTVTLYVNAERSTSMINDILALKPRRIIFNPGSENEALDSEARARNIQTLKACTLVLLTTHQF